MPAPHCPLVIILRPPPSLTQLALMLPPTPPLLTLSIAEGDEFNCQTVIANNEVSYNVQIDFLANFVLADVLSAATTITLTDTPTPAPITTVDVANGTITITGITNDCPDYTSDIPCADAATTALGDITITETSSVFTIQSGTELILSVDDVTGAQSSSFTNNDVLAITTVLDESFTFDVIIEYSGVAVADIVAGLDSVNGIAGLVSAQFGPQSSTTASYNADDNLITISNFFNADNDDETGTVSLSASTTLPTGYYFTSATFTDPAGTDAAPNTAATALNIAEGDGLTVTDNNEETYNVQIAFLANFVLADVLSAATTITLTDTPTPAPTTTVDVANGTITITGITNDCPDYTSAIPCADAATTALGSITITETNTIFTLQSGTELILSVDDVTGAQSSSFTNNDVLAITTVLDESFTFDVIIEYSGVAVADIVAGLDSVNGIAGLVSAQFGPQSSTTASYNADDNLITISNFFNADNDDETGTVSLSASTTLPTGYYFTSATFTDPAGTDAAPNTAATALNIAEGDGLTVTDNNEETYNVQIAFLANFVLADVLSAATTITLTDTPTPAPTTTVDVANGTITITGITNDCPDYTSAIPCATAATTALGSITITETNTIFTLQSGTELTLSVDDVTGAQSSSFTNNDILAITTVLDESFTFDVIIEYSGVAVAAIITELDGDDDIASLISAQFGPQSSTTASYNVTDNLITISNFFNADNDDETGTVSLSASTTLPTGYYFTPATFTDPADTDAGIHNAATALNIAEGDGLTVTDNNEETYNVQIDFLANFVLADVLSAATVITLTDTPTPAPITTVDVANGTITITGITNDCPDYTSDIPCATAATTALGSITITETNTIFTLQSGTELILSVDDVTGAQSSSFTNNDILAITTVLDESFTFDVIIEYSGVAVANIVDGLDGNDDIASLISAQLGIQSSATASYNVTGKLLTINELFNTDNDTETGTVTLNASTPLPTGYVVTPATFTNPAGTNAGTYAAATALNIAEGDGSTVTANNEETYNVQINFLAPPALDNSISNQITILPSSAAYSVLTILANGTGTIAISNITNSCPNYASTPPCAAAATAALGSITIAEDASAFYIANNAVTIAIPDQADATRAANVTLGTLIITNADDNSHITYTVTADYAGTAVADIVTAAGGIAAVLPSADVNVVFNNQDAIIDWNNDVLSITGMINPADSSPTVTGTVTVALAAGILPTGYFLKSSAHTFTDPSGTLTQTITANDVFSIAEGDGLTVTAGNEAAYALSIVLAEAPGFILTAADLDISITDTLANVITIDPSAVRIYLASGEVFITAAAKIYNFDENTHTALQTGALTLNSLNTDLTVDTALLTTFDDSPGTETHTVALGSFSATGGGVTETYDLSLVIAPAYGFKLDTGFEFATGQSIANNYLITRCTSPASTLFTIATAGTTNNLANVFLSVNNYYDSAAPTNNTNNPSVLDADGTILDTFDGVTIVVQECNTFASGNGTPGDPYLIDNDMRLDLMSRSVNGSQYSTYGAAHYTLTANVDLSHPQAPWAKDSSHSNANGTGFIPIGKTTNAANTLITNQTNQFSGELDCDTHAIANLHISVGGSGNYAYYLGLFGLLTDNANITNCSLTSPYVRGYNSIGGIAGYVNYNNGAAAVISGNTVSAGYMGRTDSSDVGGIAGTSKAIISNNTISDTTITVSNSGGGVVGEMEAVNTVTNVFIEATDSRRCCR